MTESIVISVERDATNALGRTPAEIATKTPGFRQAGANSSMYAGSVSADRERPGQKSRAGPERIGALLPTVLSELGLDDTSTGVRLLQVWDQALGELAPHCRPEGVRRGTLIARVPDSAWMQRLQLEKPRILARLQALLGEPVAQNLRFRIGDTPRR